MRASLVLLAGAALSLSCLPAAQAATDPPVPAGSDQGAPTASEAPPPSDRIIVRWAPGVSRVDRVQTRSEVNTEDFENLGNAKFQVLSLADGQDPDQAVRELKANPDVANVSRDGYSTLHAPAPNDPLFNQLWGLDNKGLNIDGVGTSTTGVDVDALDAWGKTTGDKSVVVADLDSGIRPNHPDLKNRIWTNPGETPGDGIDNDGNGIVDDVMGADFAGANIDLDPIPADNDPTDDIPQGGHGVHTAGTIAAEGNNGVGITGVAQNATIMPLRVCGWSPTYSGVYCMFSSQIAAINYAGAKGARVANMSLGGYGGDTLIRDAIAQNPKTLFVISAGNSTNNNDSTPVYPCSYDPTTSGIVGAVDNIVCVAATNQVDGVAGFSNWGKTKVDIGAPGTEILSTYVTKNNSYIPPGQEDSTSYAFLQGTSMAAPHVTGAAALLAAYEPEATVLQMRQALLSSVDPLAVLNPNTGSRPVSSGGRLNADKALGAVDALVAPDTKVTAGTTGTVPNRDAAFEFGSDAKTPVVYECAVDSGGFTGCSSPFAVNGLGDGEHTFQVRARDLSSAANADPTPATAGWTVAIPVAAQPTQPTQPTMPTAPAKVTDIKVARKKRKAIVKWKSMPSATSYEVRLGKKAKTTSRTKYTLKKLKPKKKYTVKVWAVNSAGKSPVATVKIKKAKK